ncbi:MAG: hypothetical protein KJ063_20205 [Anaerolineae bacterium]|nr:hypothetical protein [Anaerolineae bacterium]
MKSDCPDVNVRATSTKAVGLSPAGLGIFSPVVHHRAGTSPGGHITGRAHHRAGTSPGGFTTGRAFKGTARAKR